MYLFSFQKNVWFPYVLVAAIKFTISIFWGFLRIWNGMRHVWSVQSVISIWTRPVRALLGMAKPTVKEIISGTPFTLIVWWDFIFLFNFINLTEELRGKTVRKRVKDNRYVFMCFPMNRPPKKKVSSEVFYFFFSNANICITKTRFGTV